jgi:small basic protein
MIAIVALLVGLFAGLLIQPEIPLWIQPYLPIALVAALDAVIGAGRAALEKRFSDRTFVISFASNTTLAALMVFLGDQLGIGSQLSTGVLIVLAMRIFVNASAIRRLVLKA